MKAWITRSIRILFAGLVCMDPAALMATPSHAAWPERTITIVVHFAAGGSTDIVNRMIGQELSIALGQPVLVENRPGGGGGIGVMAVTRAAPDGYTLLSLTSSPLVNAALNKVQYDAVKELTGVTYIGATPNVIVTGAQTGIKSFDELVARAKANPGKLNYVSPGIGTVG
jgi:tripartite-type tricarboxylate transporter receptor subunit TctC